MKNRMAACLLMLGLLVSGTSFAGFDEGLTAYNKGDFATALKEWKPLADQGNAEAQFNLGVMYDNGQGVAQDYAQAVQWYRKSADQGDADAQNNLGVMYADGQGVPQTNVVAYALYNLSASIDPSSANKATNNRANLADSMTNREIEAAQALTRELAKPGNLSKALDQYIQAHRNQNLPKKTRSEAPAPKLKTGNYPERPAKRPGVVSCNTNCTNGSCYRTYDNGRKVHFQAKQKMNPFSGNFEWDAGSC